MKKKQKRVLMVVLGVLALGLCGLQLGPILLGGRLDDPPPKKKLKPGQKRVAKKGKGGGKKKKPRVAAKKKKKPAGGAPARSRQPARARPAQPVNVGDELDLESIVPDLDSTGRRTLVYASESLRNPFASPKFESERKGTVLTKAKFELQGIIRTRGKRLAIIDGRVYAAGDELAKGVRIVEIKASSVILVEGKSRARLAMTDGLGFRDLR